MMVGWLGGVVWGGRGVAYRQLWEVALCVGAVGVTLQAEHKGRVSHNSWMGPGENVRERCVCLLWRFGSRYGQSIRSTAH